VLANK